MDRSAAGQAGVQVGEQPPLPRNRFVLRDEKQDLIGELQVIRANYEDTFVDIGRSYGLGFDELVDANPGVDPWLPGAGTLIVLPTRYVLPDAPRQGVVLNIAAKRLFYYPPPDAAGESVVWTYPIGIGRAGWATPTGSTTVISRARDPVWYVPASIRAEYAAQGNPIARQVPPGPDNPLGRYVLGLGMPGYLIHGTNKPAGVGMRVSHGCVRLFPEDIEHLYQAVDLGVPVQIVNQPFLIGWDRGALYLEAHPPLEEDDRPWPELTERAVFAALERFPDAALKSDSQQLQQIAAAQAGFPVSVLKDHPDMDETVQQARRVKNIVTYEWMAGDTPGEPASAGKP